jgi:hypothetical protein
MIKKPRRKPAKVISIDRTALKSTSDLRVITSDAESNRMIITIGRQRFAYDVTTRITELPSSTGDQPAPVVPLKPLTGKKRPRGNETDGSTRARRRRHV